MPIWPTGKRFTPLINTLKENPPNNIISSDTDKGPPKVRRRTTANIRPISFKLMLYKTDLEILDVFYTTTCASGALAFDYVHPRTKENVIAMFTPGTQPEYNERGGVLYEATISLDILP